MSGLKKHIRKSVSMPPVLARRVQSLAKARRISQSRVLVDLIETGLAAKADEKRYYLDLLERLRGATDPAEQERLTEELAHLTFTR